MGDVRGKTTGRQGVKSSGSVTGKGGVYQSGTSDLQERGDELQVLDLDKKRMGEVCHSLTGSRTVSHPPSTTKHPPHFPLVRRTGRTETHDQPEAGLLGQKGVVGEGGGGAARVRRICGSRPR